MAQDVQVHIYILTVRAMVLVKSRYEGDIVFITQSRGGAEAEGN